MRSVSISELYPDEIHRLERIVLVQTHVRLLGALEGLNWPLPGMSRSQGGSYWCA